MPIITGNKIAAVAVFDVKDVKTHIIAVIQSTAKKRGHDPIPFISEPIQSERPDFEHPSARAKPPPKSNTRSQGKFFAVFHVRIVASSSSVFFRSIHFLVGMKNKSKMINIPTVPSLM